LASLGIAIIIKPINEKQQYIISENSEKSWENLNNITEFEQKFGENLAKIMQNFALPKNGLQLIEDSLFDKGILDIVFWFLIRK